MAALLGNEYVIGGIVVAALLGGGWLWKKTRRGIPFMGDNGNS